MHWNTNVRLSAVLCNIIVVSRVNAVDKTRLLEEVRDFNYKICHYLTSVLNIRRNAVVRMELHQKYNKDQKKIKLQ